MTRRDVQLTGLAIVWLAWAIGGEAVSIHAGVEENHVLDLAVGAAYLIAGIAAMHRRPGNRLGPLMVGVAFLWFLGNYSNARVSVVLSIGHAFTAISLVLVAWLFFAYPSGRLRTRAERVFVGSFLAWQVVFGIVVALTFDPRATGCEACVHGGLALFPSTDVVSLIETIDRWLSIVFPAWGGVLLVLKRRRATPVERRVLVPLWVGGACLVAAFGIDAFVTSDPSQSGVAYTLFQLEALARMTIPFCFLWGILRSNLDRGRVGDLIEHLSRPIPTGGLRDAMADLLQDPDLRLAFPLASGWVDESGSPVRSPDDNAEQRSFRIERDGRVLAVILHDPAIDEGLIAAAGAATAMALENGRLHAEVRAQLKEVRASRTRIVDAADAERRRIERDLHDGAQQRLLTLSFRLRAAMRRSAHDPVLAETLGEADEELRGAIAELRDLARGIHPAILTDEGLGPALGSLADRAPMPVRLTATLDRRLPAAIEAAAYFVVAEALTNAVRHAGTPVEVLAALRNGSLIVRVSDDGPGGADVRLGSGLRGLADRVAAVDGRLTIDSAVGAGTSVIAEFPCG